jgi:hypothetical protein
MSDNTGSRPPIKIEPLPPLGWSSTRSLPEKLSGWSLSPSTSAVPRGPPQTNANASAGAPKTSIEVAKEPEDASTCGLNDSVADSKDSLPVARPSSE